MQEFPVKSDALLEPLLTVTTEEQADELLSKVISEHAEPVIKGRNSLQAAFQLASGNAAS